MDAIQGAGGMYSEVRPLSHTGGPVGKTSSGSARDLPEDMLGEGAVLSLSRDYVSSALRESGFVDICAGSFAATAEVAENRLSRSPESHADLDPRTAGEVAIHFGQQVTANSIDKILEIVSRPDTDYVLKLLG